MRLHWHENLRYGFGALIFLGWLLIGLGQFAWTRKPPPARIAGMAFLGVVLPVAIGIVVAARGMRQGGSLSRVVCGVCLGVFLLVVAMFIVTLVRG